MNRAGKILLVDDEVAVRNVYQLYFETNGYSVQVAGSVGEALSVLRNERLDAVVLDIFLQEENGLELLKGMVAAGLKLPVIVISGVGYGDPLFQEALDSGAAGVFTKTLPLSQLLMEVRRVMQQRRRTLQQKLQG
jgi:two-component system response regulator HydG